MDTLNKEFPKWMYGPKGEAQIFEREDEIPEGWLDHQVTAKEGVNEEVAEAPMEESVHNVGHVLEDATSPVEPSLKSKKVSKKRSGKKK